MVAALGEALLTDYALVTWVLAATFCLLRPVRPRIWATVVVLALTVLALVLHGPAVHMNAAMLALIAVLLA